MGNMRGRLCLFFAATGFAIALLGGNAWAGPVLSYDTYLPDLSQSTLHSVLDGYDGVDKHPDADFIQPAGFVTFPSGVEWADGTKLWFIGANDRQVVGEVNMVAPNSYNLSVWGTTYGIYGDWDGSAADEGADAATYEHLIVLANISGAYYQGEFSSGVLTGGYQLLSSGQLQNDINVIPEPATMALLGLGLAGIVLRRKRLPS